MIIRMETTTAWFDRVSVWNKWFAWHPVFPDGAFVWLSHVERKLTVTGFPGYMSWWEYRLIDCDPIKCAKGDE